MSGRVWIRTGNSLTPYTLIDPTPIPESDLDADGHLWVYDAGASDCEAPYTCGLCGVPQWRGLGRPCEQAGTLPAFNTDRTEWVNRVRVPDPVALIAA